MHGRRCSARYGAVTGRTTAPLFPASLAIVVTAIGTNNQVRALFHRRLMSGRKRTEQTNNDKNSYHNHDQ